MSTSTTDSAVRTSLPPVPPELSARGVGLRAESDLDTDFLRQLYVSVRWEELAGTDWTDEAKLGFLGDQFVFQSRHYKRHYAGAAWGIVTDAGMPVGRLYLHQGPADLRIIDISMLPSHRGLGIGSSLIRAVFEQGVAAGTGVSIHVEVFNLAARRLYDRLGFVPGDNGAGVHLRMDWVPPPAG